MDYYALKILVFEKLVVANLSKTFEGGTDCQFKAYLQCMLNSFKVSQVSSEK